MRLGPCSGNAPLNPGYPDTILRLMHEMCSLNSMGEFAPNPASGVSSRVSGEPYRAVLHQFVTFHVLQCS
jgi:hypothetical protein